MRRYSSRGPSAIDYQAKPDLLAPGTGVVSLSDATSLLYLTNPGLLLNGLLGNKPYISLSGTSMAAPVVAGTVALMLQANPSLTPNLVKAAIQYTAQVYPGYNALTQGAGFLNTKGAVDLGALLQDRPGWSAPVSSARLEPHPAVGQPPPAGRRHQAERDRLEGRRRMGCGQEPDRTEHRLGHSAERLRRQHRVGNGSLRRQHRVGHCLGERRQHRLGHLRVGRQHRVGHDVERRSRSRAPGSKSRTGPPAP